MSKKIILKVTEKELKAIIDIKEALHNTLGCSKDDIWLKYVESINKMLDRNGIERRLIHIDSVI